MYRMTGDDNFRLFRESGWPIPPSGNMQAGRPNPMPFLATELYQAPSGPTGTMFGHEPLNRPAGNGYYYGGNPEDGNPWRHAQTGAQFSPMVATRIVTGGRLKGDQEDFRDGRLPIYNINVFGKGLSKSGAGKYSAAVDTPWKINILTAPPQFVSALVLGYLPPGAIQVQYAAKAAPPVVGDAINFVYDTSSVTRWGALRGINDLFVKTHSPAFDIYEPPKRLTPAIIPDYNVPASWKTDAGYRYPQQRYPGPLCHNGIDQNNNVVHDTLGSLMDISEQGRWGQDPHIGYNVSGSFDANWTFSGPMGWRHIPGGSAIDPPTDVGWTGKDVNGVDDASDNNPDGTTFARHWGRYNRDYQQLKALRPHDDSIWSDILYAFNEAVCVARAAKARFEGANYQPQTSDTYHTDPSLVCDGIAALDRLFIRCLGTDPDNPASPPPSAAIKQAWRYGENADWERFTPSNNIFTLKSALTAKSITTYGLSAGAIDTNSPIVNSCDGEVQTQVIELIVNDFRYSLFGTNPEYSAAFRPLDFNGDGAVAFSGYRKDRFAAPTQEALRQTMLIDKDSLAQSDGTGDWAADSNGNGVLSSGEFASSTIDPFCITGSLFIGRSAFWGILARGEVFDNLLKRPIAQANLESWMTVDPAQEAESGHPERLYSSHVIWQQWSFNMYQGLMLRSQ
jgi:hypothetical protein